MSTRQLHRDRSGRRGVILVVVVACLALFLSLGIAFVFYASQQAVSMRYQREEANGGRAADVNQGSRGGTDEAPPSAVDLFNLGLGQLIYGAPDDETGFYTAMRGHELARGIYGMNVFPISSIAQTTLMNPMTNQQITYIVVSTARPNGLGAGDEIAIGGVLPTGYNRPHVISPVVPGDPNDPAPPPTQNTFYCKSPTLPAATSFGFVQKTQNAPYDGFGRLHNTFSSTYSTNPASDPASIDPNLRSQDSYNIVNYSRWPFNPGAAAGGFQAGPVRYPEMESGNYDRSNPTRYIYNYISKNAPYTYPDENNMFLAAVRPSDGRVLIPSFHRPWLYNINQATSLWTGPNSTQNFYTHPYKALRAALPFPPNQNFWSPTPGAAPQFDQSYGDVENLPGKTQPQYDSIWMDLDAPVHMWRGQLYKPLFAFLVVDLDGRININTAGNVKGQAGVHTSYHGFGPWEVDPSYVLGNNAAQQVLAGNHLLSRFGPSSPRPGQRHPVAIYSLDDTTPTTNTAPGFTVGTIVVQRPKGGQIEVPNIPFYSIIDFDGSVQTAGLGVAPTAMQPYFTTPMFVQGGTQHPFGERFHNGNTTANLTGERDHHPSIYNPYFAIPNNTPLGHKVIKHLPNLSFSPWDMYYLNSTINRDAVNYPHSWLGSLALSPQLGLINNITANRMWATTISNDLHRPGLRSWLWQNQYGLAAAPAAPNSPTTYSRYSYNQTAGATFNYNPATSFPVGGPINSPTGVTPAAAAQPPAGNAPANAPQSQPGTDFAGSWRSDIAVGLGSIDLNRKLSDYRVNPSLPFESQQPSPNITQQSAARARHDRQLLARDIFYRLLVATGVSAGFFPTLTLPPPADPEYMAARRLAQLAVNIVDYIDNDDFMTPFNWQHPDTWPPGANDEVLFGTELPRLVLNEVCVRLRNHEDDDFNKSNPMLPMKATKPYKEEVWIELHNPLTPPNHRKDPSLSFGGEAALVHTLQNGQQESVYQIVIESNTDTQIRDPNNPTGTKPNPANPNLLKRTVKFTNKSVIMPPLVNGNYTVKCSDGTQGGPPASPGLPGTNPSFIVIGPTIPKTASAGTPGWTPGAALPASNSAGTSSMVPLTIQCPQLEQVVPPGATGPIDDPSPLASAPTILLERLACPLLPPQPDQTKANYNPYVAVDYVDCRAAVAGAGGGAVAVNDSRLYTNTKGRIGVNNYQNVSRTTNQSSLGRLQPYTALGAFWSQQNPWYTTAKPALPSPHAWANDSNVKFNPPTDANLQGFSHTFYKHNLGTSAPFDTSTKSFDWLVHLDRQLVSPVELFTVSAWKPHELTQQFVAGTATAPIKQQHLAQWNGTKPIDSTGVITAAWNTPLGQGPTAPGVVPQPPLLSANNANDVRLYRALGLLDVRERSLGMPFGGRVAGRVNINTIWDSMMVNPNTGNPSFTSPTFSAICAVDTHNATMFTQGDVDALCQHIFRVRKPKILPPDTTTVPLPAWNSTQGNFDRPFLPPGGASYTSGTVVTPVTNTVPASAAELQQGYVGTPQGTPPQAIVSQPNLPVNPGLNPAVANHDQGIQQTILGLPGLVQAPFNRFQHPYMRGQLLNKIHNNITTRSNTFAVYCTIGYFQVTNPGPYSATNRPILGQELGINDGTNLRHKFYAIVDRTNLTIESVVGGNQTATARPRQGQRPVFLSYEPHNSGQIHKGPVPPPGANAQVLDQTIDPLMTDPDTTQPLTNPPPLRGKRAVSVRVPAGTMNVVNGVVTLEGIYDGQGWSLKTGDTILLDTGANEERATVEVPPDAFVPPHEGPGRGAKIILHLLGAADGRTHIAHARGCIMQLNYYYATPNGPAVNVLGNPGPQPDFNYKDPRYSTVVPVAVQIK